MKKKRTWKDAFLTAGAFFVAGEMIKHDTKQEEQEEKIQELQDRLDEQEAEDDDDWNPYG